MTGSRILVFGAHPDDIEFGCGAVLLDAAARGAKIDLVVLSRGEAGSHGNRSIREKEALKAAEMMGAALHFASTPGDTRLQADLEIKLLAAKEIRRLKPDLVFAPTGHLNQHPDHRETSRLVRDANRLARYGKTPGLENWEPHASRALLFYDISSESSGDGWIGAHSRRYFPPSGEVDRADEVPRKSDRESRLCRLAAFAGAHLGDTSRCGLRSPSLF